MLSMALFYAGAGINVFPVTGRCRSHRTASTMPPPTATRSRKWWTKWPDAGIATPDFDAVDVDLYKAECKPTWKRIKPLIPEGTPQNKTGGGGLQFLFAAGTLRDGKIGPGVDSRYAGRNYIVLPPSLHPSGKRYEAIVSVLARRPKPAPEFPRESGSNSEFGHLRNQMESGREDHRRPQQGRLVACGRDPADAPGEHRP